MSFVFHLCTLRPNDLTVYLYFKFAVVGCTDDAACNFHADATDSDDSCTYAEEYYNCDGTCINDEDADGVCDELEGILSKIEFCLPLPFISECQLRFVRSVSECFKLQSYDICLLSQRVH